MQLSSTTSRLASINLKVIRTSLEVIWANSSIYSQRTRDHPCFLILDSIVIGEWVLFFLEPSKCWWFSRVHFYIENDLVATKNEFICFDKIMLQSISHLITPLSIKKTIIYFCWGHYFKTTQRKVLYSARSRQWICHFVSLSFCQSISLFFVLYTWTHLIENPLKVLTNCCL